MSSKYDEKYSDDGKNCEYDYDDAKSSKSFVPKIEILSIDINPEESSRVTDSLELKISFSLDMDVICAYW